MYQPIDQVKTEIKLKKMLKAAGYSVNENIFDNNLRLKQVIKEKGNY